MTGLTDLQTAITNLESQVVANTAALTAAIAFYKAGDNDAALLALSQSVTAATATLATSDAELGAADTPAA